MVRHRKKKTARSRSRCHTHRALLVSYRAILRRLDRSFIPFHDTRHPKEMGAGVIEDCLTCPPGERAAYLAATTKAPP